MSEALELGRMSYDDYLALEGRSETKHEYVNGRVYAMAGGTLEHSRIAANVTKLLGNLLTSKPCVVFTSDARIRIEATGRSTYPDVSVVYGRRERAQDDPEAITNPTVLVEVLSDSTEAGDRGDKFAHYRRIPSLQEYVLVSQNTRPIEVFRRREASWVLTEAGGGESVKLDSLGIALPVDEVYFDPVPDAAR